MHVLTCEQAPGEDLVSEISLKRPLSTNPACLLFTSYNPIGSLFIGYAKTDNFSKQELDQN